MKKTIFLMLAVMMIFAGCQKSKELSNAQKFAKQLSADAPKDTLLYIVNEPTKEMEQYTKDAKSVDMDDKTATYLVPSDKDAVINIYTAGFDDTANDVKKGDLYYTGSNEVIALYAYRGEVLPTCVIEVTSGEKTATYYFWDNLKDGNPPIEYVIAQ